MKVRLTVVEAGLFVRLRDQGKSHREYRKVFGHTVSGGVDLTGKIVTVAGKDYFVIEQLPAYKGKHKGKGRK